MFKLSMDRIQELLSSLGTVLAPVESAGQVNFGVWSADATLRLDALHTVKSPKDAFFPQTEELARFKLEGKNISVGVPEIKDEPFVLFGVRACDARSFDILDRVFLSDPVDVGYATRRNLGTVVTLACSRPGETCFCQTFGIDCTNPGGDITVWKTEDSVYWNANTEKGAKLLAKLELTECGDDAVNAQKENTKKIMNKLPLAGLTTEGFGGGKTMEIFNRDEWKTLSESCLGCGTCTFVCPTCQCYDVKDFNTGNAVIRYRCWDSCMYSEFTKMAHGNNRNSQVERFRQRFMHKLVYFPENNEGIFGCVGCGRCLAKCPISMNIVKVMKTIGGNA